MSNTKSQKNNRNNGAQQKTNNNNSSSNDGSSAPIPVVACRYKTKLCQTFAEKGDCPYESRCMFAHGEQELRTKEQNVADGLLTEEAVKGHQRKMKIEAAAAAASVAHKHHSMIMLQLQQQQEQEQMRQAQQHAQQTMQIHQQVAQLHQHQMQQQQFMQMMPKMNPQPQAQAQAQAQQQPQQPQPQQQPSPVQVRQHQPYSNAGSLSNTPSMTPTQESLNPMAMAPSPLSGSRSPGGNGSFSLNSPSGTMNNNNGLSNSNGSLSDMPPGMGPAAGGPPGRPGLASAPTQQFTDQIPLGGAAAGNNTSSLNAFPMVIPVEDLETLENQDSCILSANQNNNSGTYGPDASGRQLSGGMNDSVSSYQSLSMGAGKSGLGTPGSRALTPSHRALNVPSNLSFAGDEPEECTDYQGTKLNIVPRHGRSPSASQSPSMNVSLSAHPAIAGATPPLASLDLNASVSSIQSASHPGYSPSQRALYLNDKQRQASSCSQQVNENNGGSSPAEKNSSSVVKHRPLIKRPGDKSNAHNPYEPWQYNPVCSCQDCLAYAAAQQQQQQQQQTCMPVLA